MRLRQRTRNAKVPGNPYGGGYRCPVGQLPLCAKSGHSTAEPVRYLVFGLPDEMTSHKENIPPVCLKTYIKKVPYKREGPEGEVHQYVFPLTGPADAKANRVATNAARYES